MTCQVRKAPEPVSLAEIILLWIIMVSITAVGLLMLSRYSSYYSLIVGSILTAATSFFLKLTMSRQQFRTNTLLLLILLVAFFFRAAPYLWIMGGQDQGLYVNMSSTYEHTGSTIIKDRMREQVAPEDKINYDQTQVLYKRLSPDIKELQGNYPLEFLSVKDRIYFAMYQPGIYLKNLSKSEYVFQFYPLHPIWMAIFSSLFGSDNRVYSVVFFAILSIVAFFYLALEISDDNKPGAYLISAFLALNPLHAFFSKFPVSEIQGLFFSACGFFYLFRYYKRLLNGSSPSIYLILSIGSFFCMFMTHISGFMFVIFFSCLLIFMILTNIESAVKLKIVHYYIWLLAAFFISIAYGYAFSYPYFYEVFSTTFRPYLGELWATKMVVTLVVYAVFLLVFYKWNQKGRISFHISDKALRSLLLALFCLVMMLASYKIYKIGFTNQYVGHWFLDEQMKIAGKGFSVIKKANFFVFVKYLTPMAFFILVWAFAREYKLFANKSILFLYAFVIFFAGIRLIASTITPYQYYYARYLLAEIIPYSLLVVAIHLGAIIRNGPSRQRQLAAIIIVSILVYFVPITTLQFRGKEGDGAAASLSKVASRLSDNKLLIYQFEDGKSFSYVDSQILTPLMFYYNLNMLFSYNISDLQNQMIAKAMARYDEVYVLSKDVLRTEVLEKIDTIDYKHGMFTGTDIIPSQFHYTKFKLHLYRVKQA